jgi:hypothetical protein
MAGTTPPDQPGQRKFIRMTNAGGLDLDQHLAVARPVQIDLHDLKGLAGGDGNGGASLHQAYSE